MANKKNLIPQAHTLTVEEQSKGGQNSVQSRKEKKTIQNILNDFLNSNVKDQKSLKKLASSVGIKGEQSVKELVTIICILNTLQKGDVDKLQKLCELLGEDNNIQSLEDISDAETEIFGNNIYY